MSDHFRRGGLPAGVRNIFPNPPPGWHGQEKEASERRVSVPTLRRQAAAGIGPPPVKHGRHNFYRDGKLAEYLEERRRGTEPKPVQRGRPRKRQ